MFHDSKTKESRIEAWTWKSKRCYKHLIMSVIKGMKRKKTGTFVLCRMSFGMLLLIKVLCIFFRWTSQNISSKNLSLLSNLTLLICALRTQCQYNIQKSTVSKWIMKWLVKILTKCVNYKLNLIKRNCIQPVLIQSVNI